MTSCSAFRIETNARDAFKAQGIDSPEKVLGKKIEMQISQGSHQSHMVAHFVSYAWDDERGIQFFITLPEYRGRKVQYLTKENHTWYLRLEDDPDYIDSMDDGQELCEMTEPLFQHRFVEVTWIYFKGL